MQGARDHGPVIEFAFTFENRYNARACPIDFERARPTQPTECMGGAREKGKPEPRAGRLAVAVGTKNTVG